MGEDEDGRVLLAGGSSEFAPPAVVRERQSAHLRVALFRPTPSFPCSKAPLGSARKLEVEIGSLPRLQHVLLPRFRGLGPPLGSGTRVSAGSPVREQSSQCRRFGNL